MRALKRDENAVERTHTTSGGTRVKGRLVRKESQELPCFQKAIPQACGGSRAGHGEVLHVAGSELCHLVFQPWVLLQDSHSVP